MPPMSSLSISHSPVCTPADRQARRSERGAKLDRAAHSGGWTVESGQSSVAEQLDHPPVEVLDTDRIIAGLAEARSKAATARR
jgi:hypothetical protein